MSARVTTIDVPDGEAPDPEVIAARIDLDAAEYHEHCCPWLMWTADESLFDREPSCDCGGPAMAKAYAELTRPHLIDVLDPWVHFIADDNLPGFRAASAEELADRVMGLLGA